MSEILILEVIGIFSILNICSIWIIKVIHHLLAIIIILFCISMYCICVRRKKVFRKILLALAHTANNSEIEESIIKLRQIGIGVGIIGLGVFPIMLGVSSAVFIGIEIIGNVIALMGAIVLYTLVIETSMIIPLMMGFFYKKNKNSVRIKSIGKQHEVNKPKIITYEILDKVK